MLEGFKFSGNEQLIVWLAGTSLFRPRARMHHWILVLLESERTKEEDATSGKFETVMMHLGTSPRLILWLEVSGPCLIK